VSYVAGRAVRFVRHLFSSGNRFSKQGGYRDYIAHAGRRYYDNFFMGSALEVRRPHLIDKQGRLVFILPQNRPQLLCFRGIEDSMGRWFL
jgi:hypothetical protein